VFVETTNLEDLKEPHRLQSASWKELINLFTTSPSSYHPGVTNLCNFLSPNFAV
jgi:hypothetical protein